MGYNSGMRVATFARVVERGQKIHARFEEGWRPQTPTQAVETLSWMGQTLKLAERNPAYLDIGFGAALVEWAYSLTPDFVEQVAEAARRILDNPHATSHVRHIGYRIAEHRMMHQKKHGS